MMKNKCNFFSSCAVVSMIPNVLIQEIASAYKVCIVHGALDFFSDFPKSFFGHRLRLM